MAASTRCVVSGGTGRLASIQGLGCRNTTVSAYKSRFADEHETKEYKMARLAAVLGTEPAAVQHLVRTFPGLLVPDASLYEKKVQKLAAKHNVPPAHIASMVLSQPTLLFQRL